MDIIITIPKKIKWEEYMKEISTVQTGDQQMMFKVPSLPQHADIGSRCYICHEGKIVGFMYITFHLPAGGVDVEEHTHIVPVVDEAVNVADGAVQVEAVRGEGAAAGGDGSLHPHQRHIGGDRGQALSRNKQAFRLANQGTGLLHHAAGGPDADQPRAHEEQRRQHQIKKLLFAHRL